ncbi:thymidylate kinase [Branchiibius hedensis]|uniref:Thymidylate kinase n=1 Tax=Branchiibius hedensis TaxID=672460 RepID=A0A2Y8ZXS0_9MICO|nr:dTMP kinase [Branchiibius hedensis]PWJ27516.1 thymidylate kinase [Branchiibius hedensis]SSA36326.1 thymidylate kinase [Branchiibius hedensis]
MPGFFLVFEGGDGAGKTTQLTALRQALADTGREIVVTREPGGTPVGQAIRDVLLHGEHVAPRAEALLFAADRAHHVATVVRPALERDAIVLQDRYLDSSIAYQGAGRALEADDVRGLSLWGTQGLLPDLTVLLDVPAGTGRERRGEVHDRLEREADDFHGRVREHFLALAAAEPQRYLVLDATRAADDLAKDIEAAVRERLT